MNKINTILKTLGNEGKDFEILSKWYLENEPKFKIRNPELIGEYNMGICGEGPDGDKLCVVSGLTDTLGPALWIMKHKLGGSGMTLN